MSNINACQFLADTVSTTLGPRGMDKLIHHGMDRITISNDGATIMKLLDVAHPAAALLVDIAKSQDAEIGDGTTSVVLIAVELMKMAKPFIEEGVHPQTVIQNYRLACQLCQQYINEMAYSVADKSDAERTDLLVKVAQTAMNSKLIASHREQFARMAVEAVQSLDEDLREDMIGIKQVTGGAMEESELIKGVAFKKSFSYAGFEQQPKRIPNPKICLLNLELELKNENSKAEVRITNPEQYQSIVDAEWSIIFTKLEKIVATGANVILSRLAIGDLATQYFADRNIFCAGRVTQEDLNRASKATGAQIQTSVNDITPSALGTCGLFEEKQVGAERYNFFTDCPQAKTASIILRGGASQFIEEAERSLHDAIMVVRRSVKNKAVVAGAGAIEMELSKRLREHSLTIAGKGQLIISAFAQALEVIPRQLSQNAGFDATDILDQLRQKHFTGFRWAGVDITNEGVCDAFERCIWEPSNMKRNALNAATEACCLILGIDETIKAPQSEQAPAPPRGGMGGMRGMMPGMRGGRGGMAPRGRR
ncbi:putative T-complex protein 1 subunit eta [Paratrimastix pyriformis]|uniref:T-complex protein 1 subunit eta n=1 Tax=Paratrimastix pyriformis TaxID=342808 RepID=A0ABQ8U6R9_9EUKA|nr:putative T-complex protein 1 subunit eta [Paratrimastix pyriformis]